MSSRWEPLILEETVDSNPAHDHPPAAIVNPSPHRRRFGDHVGMLPWLLSEMVEVSASAAADGACVLRATTLQP